MNWLTPNLAVGSVYYDDDKNLLDAQGIRAILQLNEGDETWPSHWQALHLPVHDGQPVPCELVRAGRDFVQAQRAAGHKTLVCCLMGQSRSSSFAFICLLADGHTPQEAWRILKMRHPGAYPHPILFQSLLDCHELDVSVADLYTLKLES